MKKRILSVLIIAALVLDLSICTEAREAEPDYLVYIDGICENTYTNVDPYLVQSLIFCESSWCTGAVNQTSGCIGLMQINPRVHKARMQRLGMDDLTNGYQNIMVGIDYLSELYETYGDTDKVIDAFNGNLRSDEFYEEGNQTYYSKKVIDMAQEIKDADARQDIDTK